MDAKVLAKIIKERQAISDLLVKYIVYDQDYTGFGQEMSRCANEIVLLLGEVVDSATVEATFNE